MSGLRGWRPLLRLAWRDALRSRGRSALVLVMIALPVLGVVAADVVIATANVSGTEALDRRLGAADAKVVFDPGATRVQQAVDPEYDGYDSRTRGRYVGGLAEIRAALGPDARAIEWRSGSLQVATTRGLTHAEVSVLDLEDPLVDGLWRVDSGRAATAPGEVVVNTYLAERAELGLGDDLETAAGDTYEIVGVAEHSSYRSSPMVVGVDPALVEALDVAPRTLLVDAGGPVSWADVQALNAVGATVVSRAVLLDPPPRSEIPAAVRDMGPRFDPATLAVAGLVVVMALIEVVLLAGPAFAVGARRRARDLALMSATGGTPQQARRVILAGGLVLGGLGALLGVVLGLGVAAAVLPLVQQYSGSWLGPFEVPALHIVAIALFGLLSALLAAVVPAWVASHQDVVSVLAGRRADRPAGLRSPLLGLVLMGLGVAGAAFGALAGSGGEILIAGSAIPAVLGMILLVPIVLAGLSRLSSRLPLVLRYAVRDAARHRTRTVPAVAAVAATVAGVVALGIANASDAEQNRASYRPMMAMGEGAITAWDARPEIWPQLDALVARELPDVEATAVQGFRESSVAGSWTSTTVHRVGGRELPLDSWGNSLGASVLVFDTALPAAMVNIGDDDRAAASRMLASGGAVVFANRADGVSEVRLKVRQYGPRGGRGTLLGTGTFPAHVVEVPRGTSAPAQVVVSPEVADALDAPVERVGLALGTGIGSEQEKDVEEAVAAISENASLYVERGFQNDDETVILLLVLGALGGLLMLGGTLTATFLALSDARPDLATLGAVGASPRSRRGVAASYAVVVGLTGALLGALVGFIPGVAITYPLTGDTWGGCTVVGSGGCTAANQVPTHYLDIPWLLVGSLVVALPLLTALIVGLTARSRLPLASRLA